MERIGQVNVYIEHRSSKDAKTLERQTIKIINLANGTTPFIHVFNGVEYMSNFYRIPAGGPRDNPSVAVTVTHAHYRPKRDEFDLLKPDEQDHILNGGLWVGPLYSAVWRQLVDDPVQPEWGYEKFQEFALRYYGRRLPPEEKP